MSETPSEEEILAGLLPLRIGGQRVTIDALPLKPGREWFAKVAEAIKPIAGMQIRPDDWSELPETFRVSEDVMLDALVAYDRHHTLGTRAKLEDTLFGPELGPAFNALIESVVPFDRAGLQAAGLPAVVRPAPKSTNGASGHGVLSPELSSIASPPDN